MSVMVDERVVEMQFDNKQFESNVSTTMSTLDKLKQSLNLSGATKGLEEVDAASKRIDLSPLRNAAETVGLKFNAMYTIADQALRNITNSAVNAGKRIVEALTIKPIRLGFSEYETQMNAVQTILANTESKGKTLDDVNKALDELNLYADKTIYNFTQMTRNIGTFTAAGVDLDTSVSAIKGIANLAAVSGSTSQQASTAMYQLSQALASGTVKLMDWNSVVNAGMGGQVFQDALKETAKVHGVAIDDIIKKQGSFRESLSEGWLTSEILTETLSKFTGDLTEDQLKSMGYTEEQIKGIIKMGQTANDAATKVKTFSQLFETLQEAAQSGWTQTWEIIVGDFEEAKEFLTEVSDTIGGMIGSSAEARNELLENWKVLGGRTALIDSIRNAFEAVMNVIKPVKEAFREIFPPLTAEQLMSFTNGLKNLTENLKISDETADNIKRTFKGLFAVVDIVKEVFMAAFKATASLFGAVTGLGGGVLDATASFGDWLVSIRDAIKASGVFTKVFQGVADVIKAVIKGGSSLVSIFKEKILSPGWEKLQSLLSKIGDEMVAVGEFAGKMKDGVVSAIETMSSVLEKCSFFTFLEAAWRGIQIIGAGLVKAFRSIMKGMSEVFDLDSGNTFFTFINNLLSGGIILGIINFFNKVAKPFEHFKELITDFTGSVKGILEDVRGVFQSYQDNLKAKTLGQIAGAIALLVGAIVVLSLIDTEKLTMALGALSALFVGLILAFKTLNSIESTKGFGKTAAALISLSSALLILSIAMKIMSTMSFGEMLVGLISTAAGLGMLVLAVNLLPEENVKKAASAIKKLSTSLLILAVALKIMSTMSPEGMAIALVSMCVGLAALVTAINMLPKDSKSKAGDMLALAGAMLIISAALKIMSTMSITELGIAMLALAGSLAAIVIAMNSMKNALPGAAAMLIVAPALVILAGALKILGTMSLEQVGIGLVAIGGALAILAIAMHAMKETLPGVAALILAVGALAILAPVLVLLGSMSIGAVVQSLVTIAAAFTIIGIAGAVLQPVIPSILSLAGALALIGIAALGIGIGLLAAGAGLSALAVGITALAATVTTLPAIIAALIDGVITGLAQGIISAAKVIIASAPVITEAFIVIVTSIISALKECIPPLLDCIGLLLNALLKFLLNFVPNLVDAGIKLIVGLLDGIASNIGDVIDAAVNLVIEFMNGIVQTVPQLVDAGFKMIVDFLNGLADAIRKNTQLVIDATNNLMEAIVDAGKAYFKNFKNIGKDLLDGLIEGVKSKVSDAVNAVKNAAKSMWEAAKDFLQINSPSKKFIELGMGMDEGLAVGITEFSKLAEDAAVDVGKSSMDSLSDTLSGISDVVSGDVDLEPTIRPVLDLSDVKSGADSISGLLNSGSSVGVNANLNAINSKMSQRNQNGGDGEIVSAINKLRKDIGNVGGTTYNVNGITYDDGSGVAEAINTIVRAAKIERRS